MPPKFSLNIDLTRCECTLITGTQQYAIVEQTKHYENKKLSFVVLFHLVTPFWNPNCDWTLDGINWMKIFKTLFDALTFSLAHNIDYKWWGKQHQKWHTFSRLPSRGLKIAKLWLLLYCGPITLLHTWTFI